MSKNEMIMLPREVVEQMIENMKSIVGDSGYDRMLTRESEQILRAALDQPKNHIEQHLGMVPTGWKLVLVEPTKEMLLAFAAEFSVCSQSETFPTAYRAMLAAAPQPPALDQPQFDQAPYLWYDPENGDTWTQEAVDEGFCATDGLIPLYENQSNTKGKK